MKLRPSTKFSVLLGGGVLALLVIGYVVNSRRLQTVTPAPTLQPVTHSSQEIVRSLIQELGFSDELTEGPGNDWITNEGAAIPLRGWWAAGEASEIKFLGKYIDPSDQYKTSITEEGRKELKNRTNAFFLRNGFTQSERNTSQEEFTSDETVGYENQDIKCFITTRTLVAVGSFFCGTLDEEQARLRKDFLPIFEKLLNPQDSPDLFVNIIGVEGNYAIGSSGGKGGGAGWFAVKQNGKWEIVLQTQNYPPCSVMEKYNFPKSLYGECGPDYD